MKTSNDKKKTILLAFGTPSDALTLCDVFPPESYRLLHADNILSLINSLERYMVDLLIVEADLTGISTAAFLPFLRERYGSLKVIVAMKEYSAKLERTMRPHKILYVMTWPLNSALLQSIVERGLAYDGEAAKTA
jgi:DNA-binding NtrC family response regulator